MPDTDPAPPKATGRVEDVHLTGMLIPWQNEQPVFMSVAASSQLYLPVFSDRDELERVMRQAKADWQSVKEITDESEFLREIPNDITIMVNPRFMPDGKVRWMEVRRN